MSPLMVYQHDSPAAMNSKRSTNKFRARNMVLVSCIDEFACRFPTGCPYGLDEATIQKRQAIEAYCSNNNRCSERGRASLVELFRIFGHGAGFSGGEAELF